MLSLTYGAVMIQQAELQEYNRLQFTRQYIQKIRNDTNGTASPTNLFSFVYLRGLDGQTIGLKPLSSDRSSRSERGRPLSWEELKNWVPDANKAEGEAQFDYLARLGDQLVRLEKDLQRDGRGRIDAVGIVGSDTYDTLLILQALRAKFDNAVFFTTDLDARMWHPNEQTWTRNLVVVSSYGLSLSPKWQGGVPPFRDSSQTAQFVAVRAALGNTNLASLTNIEPRRFEISRTGAYDLSVRGSGNLLHPTPLGQTGKVPWSTHSKPVSSGVAWPLAVVGGSLLLSLLFRPLRRLTWGAPHYHRQSLWLREEDVGGSEGVAALFSKLSISQDPRALRSKKELEKKGDLAKWFQEPPRMERQENGQRKAVVSTEQIQSFLDHLNPPLLDSQTTVESSTLVSDETKACCEPYAEGNSPPELSHKTFENLMTHLFKEDWKVNSSSPTYPAWWEASRSSRQVAKEVFHKRRQNLCWFWTGMSVCIAVLLVLIRVALRDTFECPNGEPFEFFSGISAWPTELLRYLAVVLAVGFGASAYRGLRTDVFEITRRYRLPFKNEPDPIQWFRPSTWFLPSTSQPVAMVDADTHWERFQEFGRFWPRFRRTLPMFLLYLTFAVGLFFAADPNLPARPVRGPICAGGGGWPGVDMILLGCSVLALLFLTFWTIDAAQLCRWFIERLSQAPTRYPKACLEHFRRTRGIEDPSLLEEWLDLRLIADVTDRVGRMVYLPFIVFSVLLLSRHSYWDRWPWPPALVAIFGLNLLLAAISVIILQRAARKARDLGITSLSQKLNQRRQLAAKDEKVHNVNVGDNLLKEIETLHSGAFVTLWENPVLGAILLPSGGMALIELLAYVFRP